MQTRDCRFKASIVPIWIIQKLHCLTTNVQMFQALGVMRDCPGYNQTTFPATRNALLFTRPGICSRGGTWAGLKKAAEIEPSTGASPRRFIKTL